MTLDKASMELVRVTQRHLMTLSVSERRKFIRAFNTLAKQAEQRLRARHKKHKPATREGMEG